MGIYEITSAFVTNYHGRTSVGSLMTQPFTGKR